MQTKNPDLFHKVGSLCCLSNEHQPDIRIQLTHGGIVAVTYSASLRVLTGHEDPLIDITSIPDKVLISPAEASHKLKLAMWHGRQDPDSHMDDWGYDGKTIDGFPGYPTADAALITKEGVNLCRFQPDGQIEVALVPFHNDLLLWQGHYFGDFSLDCEV